MENLGIYVTIVVAMTAGGWTVFVAISNDLKEKFKELNTNMQMRETDLNLKIDKHEDDVHAKIGRAYARLDEVKIDIDKRFMTREVHSAELNGIQKNIDQRILSIMEVISVKFENQEKSIRRIEEFIKDRFNKI